MKRKLFLILYLIVIYNICFAQNGYFNNVFNYANIDIIGISIVKDDTSYITVSFALDSTNYSRINFSRFDVNGNLLFEKNYGASLRAYFPGHSGSLQKLSDGNFMVSGAFTDSIGTSAFLLKVDQIFDSILFKVYEDSSSFHYMEFQQGIETNDKGFIMGGAIVIASHTQAALLIKTDSLGNLIYKKIFTLAGIDNIRNVIQTTDKGYLLSCYGWNYYSSSYSGDPWVIKLDSNGNEQWRKKFGGSNKDGSAIVALASDSNYLVTYSYAYITIPQVGSNLKIDVLKLDKFGNTIWDKQYDSVWASRYSNMIKVLTNGEIIVIGVTDFWDGINYFNASWALKLKSNGDSIYFRKFNKYNDEHTNTNTANDFCINNDNSIVICGVVQEDPNYQSLWLVKIDSNGCLQPGCNNVGIEEIKTKMTELKVFPNPANNQTTIVFPQQKEDGEIQIYNTLGQLVYEEKLTKASSQIEINIQNFKAGLYKVIVREKGIIKGQVSLVKE